jgi:hypothetical protein
MGKSRVMKKRDHLGNLGIHGWLVDLTETGYDSTGNHLAEDMNQCSALVNTVMNLWYQ